MQLDGLAGKVALVTGAASGLGFETALCFAQSGANLFLVDRNAEGLEKTKAEVDTLGVRSEILVADLADPQQCTYAVERAVATFSQLDALCNVAGVHQFAHSTDMSVEDWDKVLSVNLRAPFLLSKAALPHLFATAGSIVNVASAAAFQGEAYSAAYCASKAGIVHMTKAMAVEYLHKPIRINAIAPSGMMTGMSGNRPPEGIDRTLLERFIPVRGLVAVPHVATMIVMLCSDLGKHFHGACINLDNGAAAG